MVTNEYPPQNPNLLENVACENKDELLYDWENKEGNAIPKNGKQGGMRLRMKQNNIVFVYCLC